jgi:hypothetical protein
MTTFSTAHISEADFYAIENALQSSEKGRRFLRAYVDRNRSLESLRLLRSISRLHRAALGTPAPGAEARRDLTSMLKSVSSHRRKAFECDNDAERANLLTGSLEEVEASLIALIESLEEKAFETLRDEREVPNFSSVVDLHPVDRTQKLFAELSSFFSTEPR